MTAKEKANELIEKFYQEAPEIMGTSKAMHFGSKIALITVNEILNDLQSSFEVAKELNPQAEGLIAGSLVFWNEVKNEIDKVI